jgi:N-acetylglucosaminylphosphatidylinositol deacetylase
MRLRSICAALVPSFWFVLSLVVEVYIFMLVLSASVSLIPGRTLFVIAHPDDEVMFFGPSILRSETAFILSISSGSPNSSLRASEFQAACQVLGTPGRCFIDKANALPDGFQYEWSREDIRSIVSKFVKIIQPNRIVTFDRHGVSKHPNHVAIWRALAADGAKKNGLRGNETFCEEIDVPIYWLRTAPGILKYMGFYGAVAQFFGRSRDVGFFAMTPPSDIISMKLEKAFLQHQSQQVWYRMVWMVMSRFMYFNHLKPGDAQG